MLSLPLIIFDLDLWLKGNISVLNITFYLQHTVPNINFLCQEMKEDFVLLAYLGEHRTKV